MTDNYTGDLLITQQQKRVVTQVANKKLHMRDVLTTLTADPAYLNLPMRKYMLSTAMPVL